jgi:hypothetical protein
MVRLLTGNGTTTRRFPDWLLNDHNTVHPRPFPGNGPFKVVRQSHRRRLFTNAQQDEAEALLVAAR